MPKTIESVAILGGGFMGLGIAESASIAGFPVLVRELPEFIAAARERLQKSLDSAVSRGKLDAAKRDAALDRISFTNELKDVGGSDLVIEAVPENLALKISIMKELDEIVGHDTILASNTSSIPIAQLGGAVSNPSRVLGLHFFLTGAGDEVGGDRARTRHERRNGGSCTEFRYPARQAAHRDQGSIGVHRQFPADALPDGRGSHVRGGLCQP